MRRTVRTIALLLLIGSLVGIGLAVLYFGTSTGLVAGGADTATGGAAAKSPYFAQVGWIRNTSPWPITITKISTNASNAAGPADVYVELKHDSSKSTTGTEPNWAKISPKPPCQVAGNSLRYLGFALTPAQGQVASLTSITVEFSGPLGFHFSKTFSGTVVAARANGLPTSIIGTDPSTDPESLDNYLALLRATLGAKKVNYATLAEVMGGNATTADAKAFKAKEHLFTEKYQNTAKYPTATDPTKVQVTFYKNSPTSGLPVVNLTWAAYRWSVDRG